MPMVYHNQKGIKASGRGKVGDGVTRDLLEGAGCRGVSGGERGNSGVSVSFVLLAGCTAFDIFMDVKGKAWPLELSCDELVSFQVSGVACSFVIVATLEDGVVKGFIIGDIYVTLVGRNTRFDLPV